MVVVHREARGRRRRSSSSLTLSSLWVLLLVLSQLISLSLAFHQEEKIPTKSKLVEPPLIGRKTKLFSHHQQSSKRVEESFPGAPSPAQVGGDQDKVYEDDKRLVHTGPNPLHN